MPHIVVKLWPGKSDEQKAQLTEAIVREVTGILGSAPKSVSVGFEEVPSEDWTEQVFEPDVLNKMGHADEGARLRAAARRIVISLDAALEEPLCS